MAKTKKYRFRCALCGFVAWQNRLSHVYPLEVIDVYSDGRGLIKNVYLQWDSSHPLYSAFESHFYDVLEYLLLNRYIRADIVEKIASGYSGKKILTPRCIFKPRTIYHPRVINHPKLVGGEK